MVFKLNFPQYIRITIIIKDILSLFLCRDNEDQDLRRNVPKENATIQALGRLLDGYDRRIRPYFASKLILSKALCLMSLNSQKKRVLKGFSACCSLYGTPNVSSIINQKEFV